MDIPLHEIQYVVYPENTKYQRNPIRENFKLPEGNYFKDNPPPDDVVGNRYTPIPYLLIGFDTEYQSPESLVDSEEWKSVKGKVDLDKESERKYTNQTLEYRYMKERGLLQNEILSYQFHCKIVNPIMNDGKFVRNEITHEWEGIVFPHQNTTTEKQRRYKSGKEKNIKTRLLLRELLYFIIVKGIIKYPNITIPTDSYLLSHFSRADIPSLMDYRIEDGKVRDSLQNTRGSFVSRKDVEVRISDEVKFKIKIRDTILLAPAMKKKLEDLGKMLGEEKIQLDSDKEKEYYWKTHMKEYMENHYEDFKRYGIRDARITAMYSERLLEIHMKQTGNYILPKTLTSIAVTKLINMWKEEDWIKNKKHPERDLLGIREKKYEVYNEKTQRSIKKKYFPFVDNVEFQKDFVTNSYHGGRNEQFIFGITWKDEWSDWDLTSAYPTAMSMIGEVSWEKSIWSYSQDSYKDLSMKDIGFYQVDFEFPSDVRYPCLPVRTPSGIIFPIKGRSICGLQEVKLADNLKAKITVIQSVLVPSNRKRKIFEKFAMECIKQRKNAEDSIGKDSLEKHFWKEMSNSTYGKTAQGLRRRMIYDLKLSNVKALDYSRITHPFFASFITSYVRATLAEVMNNIPRDKCIFSVTTDGFLTNSTDKEMEESQHGELCKVLKQQMKKIKGNETILEVKHKVKQLLGWRTRGQATIEEGDWLEGDDNLVLAKSGIKLADEYEKTEQNRTIVDYFINRKYSHKTRYSNLSGVREVWEYDGNDMVSKPIIKTLNMEFDYKRKPSYLKDVNFKWRNKEYTHLYFETEPWKDLEEYTHIRSNIESFNKNETKLRCMKTVEDFKVFKNYVDERLAIPQQHKAYLHKKDGGKERIRQMILCAYRKEQAGVTDEMYIEEDYLEIDNIKYKLQIPQFKKISWSNWVKIFKDVGIECKKLHIQNSHHSPKEYTPHRIPKTEKTESILKVLKYTNFPKLNIEELLSNEKGIELITSEESKYLKSSSRLFK